MRTDDCPAKSCIRLRNPHEMLQSGRNDGLNGRQCSEYTVGLGATPPILRGVLAVASMARDLYSIEPVIRTTMQVHGCLDHNLIWINTI